MANKVSAENGEIHLQATVPAELAMERLDRVASQLFREYSRSRLQSWIKSGELTVDGETWRPRDKVSGGEDLEIDAVPAAVSFRPQPIPLNIVFEDEWIIVLDKPAGLVVHPGAGNIDGTLMNGLLHHCSRLEEVPRAGIVHRLDKDTTGLMVVAKSLPSQNALVQQLQARKVSRVYEALVYGVMDRPGRIDAPIARNRDNRLKMAVQTAGKEAITHYRPLAQFGEHTQVELSLETGRTHQIRVHMQYLGHPIIGDATYGGGFKMPRNKRPDLIARLDSMPRQALHARRLSLAHPKDTRRVSFESDLPADMVALLDCLAAKS